MASYKILLLFILVSLLMFATTQAQINPNFIYQNCSGNTTTVGSTFQSNLKTLLSSLSSNAPGNSGFNNTTVRAENPSESVFGLFMCRGDVPPQLCQTCVQNATHKLSTDSECFLSKTAVIWYDECTVRYSNRSFFSTVDTRPSVGLWNTANISNQESFMRLMLDTINQAADEAASNPIGEKKFATRKANVAQLQSLYCLAQCTPDLSREDCRTCLSEAIGLLPWCCEGKQGGRILAPSCNVRYELYPFYRNTTETEATPSRVPASNFAHTDSQFSEDPTYLNHSCATNATADSAFKKQLKTLFSYMSSNATIGIKTYKDVVDDTVYGLFMCRGDLPSPLCAQCILNATQRISSNCNSFQEAIIWYSHCLLRYSHRYFFSKMETSPTFRMLNLTHSSSPVPEQEFFTYTLSNMLANLAKEARDSNERYVIKSSKVNDLQTLYTLGQCTPDLSSDDCKGCLEYIVGEIPWYLLASVGGRVLYPSCNLRFELFQFYRLAEKAQPPTSGNPPPSVTVTQGKKRRQQLRTIILIIVPTVISVTLFFLGCFLIKRKRRKSAKIVLRENFGHESATLEPLRFNLFVVEAATNNFSNDNRIGKGGFGEVYKGILSDGRQIAVKRLSTTSKQGDLEFKNEVLLIAKLQHRNLVTFIGFCIEEQNKILIYEYVTNKSLDYFLFDSQRMISLSWFERYNIIGGIAQGILYLHEHSRLKVIHRDLKPSNVLLDENMNPKISDFGLARIIEINQDQVSTNRIVGTYGYMSPEYAMFGQFSEKSDVFSFGVMVLEIITGKKIISSYEPNCVADGLLNYVWRQWRGETMLSILDPIIKKNYSEIEVIKCIQIGLLCVQQNPNDRPTMVEVVLYLSNNHLIEMPNPQEPAFFLRDRKDPKSFGQESSSRNRSTNSSTTLFSINDMSISQFIPR
ncbi:hypothetical protein VNO78_32704 [Psophocarpus tetragonolobus]|uniref:Cysteine-rich receptor-like protein kinase 25 n=1 Tax=Psophocarpus tetragonolobus TaxID=3891 RepID=A0AAN9NW01_PSOTE